MEPSSVAISDRSRSNLATCRIIIVNCQSYYGLEQSRVVPVLLSEENVGFTLRFSPCRVTGHRLGSGMSRLGDSCPDCAGWVCSLVTARDSRGVFYVPDSNSPCLSFCMTMDATS